MELFIIRVKFAIYYFLHFNKVRQVAARLRRSLLSMISLLFVFMNGVHSGASREPSLLHYVHCAPRVSSLQRYNAQYTPPTTTRLNSTVESRRRCVLGLRQKYFLLQLLKSYSTRSTPMIFLLSLCLLFSIAHNPVYVFSLFLYRSLLILYNCIFPET